MAEVGDSFHCPTNHSSETCHLWLIILKVPPDLLIVNLTTEREHSPDKATILVPGDHPFIQQPTVISNIDGKRVSEEQVYKLVQMGCARWDEKFRPDVVRRIQDGFAASSHTKRDFKRFFLSNDPRTPTQEGASD